MISNIVATVFYILAFASLLSSATLVKKTDKKMNVILSIVVVLMAICCFQVFAAAMLNLMYIPVNKISLGVIDAVSGSGIWFWIVKKKEKQAFYLDKYNLLGLGVLGIVFIWFILSTCTLEFSPHYLALDAARHFEYALEVIAQDEVDTMFFSALHHSLFVDLFAPFVSQFVWYKLFVISDLLHLFFAWILFYVLIDRYAKDKFLKLAAIVVSVIYAMGYPANSTLFGFTYLGTGIAVISYLLIVYDWFIDDEFDKKYVIAFLSLGCLGIFECYVMFMPIVFFAILFGMFYKQWKAKHLVSWETVKNGLGIFGMPTVLGLLFMYVESIREASETSYADAIILEGGIYRDLFSNFIVLVPFVLCAFVYLIKEKKNKLNLWLFPLLLGFMLALLVMGVRGKASSYYFYKNYYLLWLLAFELFFVAICYLGKEIRMLLSFGFLTGAAVFAAFYWNIEGAIQNKVPLFVPSVKAEMYIDIYSFNRAAISLPPFSSSKLDMFRYVVEEIGTERHEIAIASSWEDWFWYEKITGDSVNSGCYHWLYGEDYFFETLEESEYVIVCYDSTVYQNHPEKFEELEAIFSTDDGAIYKIK